MYTARARSYLSRCVADAFLAGEWNERALIDRVGRALDRRPRWVRAVTREVLAAYPRPPADRPRELAGFIARAIEIRNGDGSPPPRVRRWLVPSPSMGRMRWAVPEIASTGRLANFLGVSDAHLAWLADARGLERAVTEEKLRHYRYIDRPRTGRPVRVIERPKQGLKEAQRQILHEVLDRIPVHDAAHGFTRGRSVRTHAQVHTGQHVVVRFDLEDFFASIAASRVYGIFRTAGYPESVAHSLTALTTNVVSARFWQSLPRPCDPTQVVAHHRLGRKLATPHLPQGAPTSPALANLAAFRLDRRLSRLAASLDVNYSRYADDLTFSGPTRLVRLARSLRGAVDNIATSEGFRINGEKTALATRAGRQRICGIVVNEHLNVAREEYDTCQSHPAQLAPAWPEVAEPAGNPRLPGSPGRTRQLDRLRQPSKGREATPRFRGDRLGR